MGYAAGPVLPRVESQHWAGQHHDFQSLQTSLLVQIHRKQLKFKQLQTWMNCALYLLLLVQTSPHPQQGHPGSQRWLLEF